ncbi:MAG: hypothetical protein O7G84_00505, partial [Gammaproteobacteria bacterium]|nr:hypothetical protein [Gammaproteobacteria bacterium]
NQRHDLFDLAPIAIELLGIEGLVVLHGHGIGGTSGTLPGPVGVASAAMRKRRARYPAFESDRARGRCAPDRG